MSLQRGGRNTVRRFFQALSQRLDKHLLNFVTKGDVNYVTVVGKPIIVLNSYQAARDLLEKRSSMYSGRPRMVMQCELCVHLHSQNR